MQCFMSAGHVGVGFSFGGRVECRGLGRAVRLDFLGLDKLGEKVPFRVAKIGSARLPVPQSGSDLYRKNDYTQ